MQLNNNFQKVILTFLMALLGLFFSSELSAQCDTAITMTATAGTACEGGTINLVSTVTNPITGNATGTNTTDVPIPDLAISTSTIDLVGIGTVSASMTITVTINMNHTFDSDLIITLIGPEGCGSMILSNHRGGNGDNFTGTVFSTTATIPIASGTAPFAGTFLPDGNISTLVGCNINGTWTLQINDNVGIDFGTLFDWSLTIGIPYTHTHTGPGTISSITYSDPSNSIGTSSVSSLPIGQSTFDLNVVLDGCSTTQSAVGKIFDTPNISSASTTCATGSNGTITVNADPINNANFTGPDIGSWQYSFDGGTSWGPSNVATGLTAGTYIIVVRNSAYNSCQSTTTATVSGIPSTTPGSVSPVCEGNSFVLTTVASGGIPSTTYTGTAAPNAAIPDGSMTGASSGIAIVGTGTVSSSTGISVTLNVTHTQDQDVDIFLVGPANCGAYLLSTDNGGAGDNYTGTFITTTGSTNIALGTAPFSGIYKPEGLITAGVSLVGGATGSYTLPSNNLIGCPVNGTWTLYVYDDFSGGGTGTFVNWSLGITPSSNYTSTFSGGSGTISSVTYSGTANANASATVTGASVGINTYSITSTLISCTSPVQNSIVKVYDIPNIINAIPSCSTGNNGTITISATINNANFTGTDVGTIEYSLNGTTWQSSNIFTGLASGSYNIYVRNTANTSCVSSAFPVTLLVGPAITITPASANTNCTTPSASFTASGGTSYTWSNNLGITPMVTVTPSSTTTYTVTATDAIGCTATAGVTVTTNLTPPTAGITNNTGTTTLTCLLTSISVTATGGTSYTWSGGLGSSANATINNIGTYTVTVTDANGCMATASITITFSETIAGINASTTELNCIATSIVLTATGGGTYLWDDNSTSPARTINTSGTYTVTVTGTNGCTASSTIAITNNSSVPNCPVPTGLLVSGITSNSAVLYWESAPCSISIWVTWHDPSGNIDSIHVTTSSALMSNLSPGTTYVVTAMSDCGTSMSISSAPVSFTTLSIFYQDADGDSYGNPAITTAASSPPAGYVANQTDCNDNNPYIHPDAIEICNSLDDNCNGQIDEAGAACFTPVNPVTLNIQATTADLNWLAVPCAVQYRVQFRLPGDASYTNGPVVNVPNISVTLSGLTASTTYQWRVRAICNNGSSTPNTSPIIFTTLPPPVPWYQDADGDGYGNPAVSITASLQPQGYVSDHTDCFDIPGIIGPTIHPGATEICDNLDNNCNGQTDEGVDGSACSVPAGLATNEITYHSARVRWYRTECVGTYKVQYRIQGAPNYTNGPTVNFPDTTAVLEGLAESTNYQWRIRSICFNGSSSAFSLFVPFTTPSSTPTWYADTDSDGYGDPDSTTVAGTQPPGYVAGNTDCNDANVNIHPGATEYCNGIDDDCDGLTDESAIDCPTPTGQTVTTITATKARLNWLAANCATTYNVQYRVRGTSTLSSRNVSTLYLQLSNLLPGTQYEWRVRAKCGLYFSAFTTPLVRFTTLASLVSVADDQIQTTDKSAQKSMPFERSPRFSISPNPSNGLFNLQAKDLANGTSHIKVMDQLGKTCYLQSVPVTKGEIQLQIDLTSLSSGLYFILLMNGNEVWGEKVSVW